MKTTYINPIYKRIRDVNHRSMRRNRPIPRLFLRGFILVLAVFVSQTAFGQSNSQPANIQTNKFAVNISAPPVAPVQPVTDTLYGVKITDPYRYMENLKDPSVQHWFRQQNAYTRSVLARIPGRDKLLADIKKYDHSVPAKVSDVARVPGELYFYEKTLPDQQMAKLYMRHGLNGSEQLLFDPAKYEKKGGPQWTISYYSPSFDGHYVAIGIAPGGSEKTILHVLNTQTGKETGEVITIGTSFTKVSWRHDNRSFFYTRLPKSQPNTNPSEQYAKSQVHLHVVGSDPAEDQTVFGYGISSHVKVRATDFPPYIITSANSPYAIGTVDHGNQKALTLYVVPLEMLGKSSVPWKKIVSIADEVTSFTIHKNELYLLTHRNAPRNKILRIDLSHPDIDHAQTVVPQRESAIIKQLGSAKDALYINEDDGVDSHLLRIPYSSESAEDVALPYDGTISLSTDEAVLGTVFSITSWTHSRNIFKFKPKTGSPVNTHLQPTGPSGDARDLETREVKVESYDGTQVPLTIVFSSGTKLDGSNPTLLFGYGAYGSTFSPRFFQRYFFDPRPWYDQGGIIAIAHVRGGGEYGESWHKAGQKLTKPNTWRDFIACARYMIRHKYTSPTHLGAMSGSAGGLLVGRAITERPNLFAAVIDESGVSNPLRYESMPGAATQIPEFGSIRTESGFEDLYAMDSYQHVRDDVKYPAILFTVGWNDPYVAPWQSAKMTARLQSATASDRPVLLRVDYNAGHAGGTSRQQHTARVADELSFVFWQFGIPGFQPGQ